MNEIVKDLHQLTIDIEHKSLADTLSELRNRINEPFMFVIVGEVKSGKSSFINALLDTQKEICKVAPDPCTDIIQQILYGQEEHTLSVNPHLNKVFIPVEILSEISIVDTPGTNTIIEHHQEITERFVPASDLIVFVFEAKNPYRQSAWEFFDYIRNDWHKKILFVLQQADLMSPEDLQINITGTENFARKKGIEDPQVFAVSAKLEQAGDKENSGFQHIRSYISTHITGGKAPLLKLRNNFVIAQNIMERILQGLDTRDAQWKADIEFRKDITETLQQQARLSGNQVDLLLENLLATYDGITYRVQGDLGVGLGLFPLLKRSFLSGFSKEQSIKDWVETLMQEMENELGLRFQQKLSTGVKDLAESIQQMAKLIDLKIKDSKTILPQNHDIFGKIADRRSLVMFELQERFEDFLQQKESFIQGTVVEEEINFSPDLLTGSGLAVIGLILAGLTQGVVLDVTGGIITTLGLLFAGLTVSFKRKKLISRYKEEILKGRKRLESGISEKLLQYIEQIRVQIEDNFQDFDTLLVHEEEQLKKLNQRYAEIASKLHGLKREYLKDS